MAQTAEQTKSKVIKKKEKRNFSDFDTYLAHCGHLERVHISSIVFWNRSLHPIKKVMKTYVPD